MDNIWSSNKYLNLCINILLFLTGINFLHYGQLFLPIICLLLFINNKLIFKVNNLKTFIILCLFAISFFGFTYNYSFYCVMGFTFPMAYYIGSNMYQCNEENIKKIIFLFAFAMGLHIFLDILYELSIRSLERIINSSSHYDIWLKDKISSTSIAIDLVYLISCFYYLIYFEKNTVVKYSGIVLFAIDILYCIIIGRRTSLLLFVLCLCFSYIYHGYLKQSLKQNLKKALKLILIVFVVCLVILGAIYLFNIDNLFIDSYLFHKIKSGLFDHSRIDIYIQTLKLMPYHLLGKQEISAIVGMQPHELWLDVYDYAGIISYLLLHCYTFLYFLNIIKTYKSKLAIKHKILFMTIFMVTVVQSFLEPLMTGMSIFLIVSIIVVALIERLHCYE